MAATTRATKKNRRLKPKRARLLQARTPVAVRRIARAFLAAARRARQRLHVQGDGQALHDFRVALRRLRSTLRIYRPAVDARMVPRKWRRRLKRLARTTGAARDAEVGLAWLSRRRDHIAGEERAACDALINDWSARRDEAYAKLRRTLDKEFTPLDAGLHQALAAPAGYVTAPMLAPTAGALMHDQIAELGATLHRIASAADTRTIHAARIEAKRLRYLLEPLANELTAGKALLKSLKKFQEDFGELCDRQVLCEELVAAAAHRATERSTHEMQFIFAGGAIAPSADAPISHGLRALAARLSVERKQRYTEIEQRYLGQRADAFLAPYRTLADALMKTPTASRRKAVARRGNEALTRFRRKLL